MTLTDIILLIFLLGLGVGAAWLAFVEYRLRVNSQRLSLLLTGRGGADLEQALRDYVTRMDRTESETQQIKTRLMQLERFQPFHLQHVGVVRYNPFADKGGDQSFAIAILDAHADGLVMTGLHSRSDMRVYTKPVVGGQSTYALTAEELEAIARAMGKK